MREILILLGCLIMAVIFFDAYRRVRDQRRSQFGVKLDDSPISSPTNHPMGDPLGDSIRQDVVSPDDGLYSQGSAQSQSQLHSGLGQQAASPEAVSASEPSLQGKRQLTVRIQTKKNASQSAKTSPQQSALNASASSAASAVTQEFVPPQAASKPLLQPTLAKAPEDGDFYAARRNSQAARQAQEKTRSQNIEASKAAAPSEATASHVQQTPDEVIAMYVVAKEGESFVGEQLVHKLLSLDMRHGEMKIFHRYERPEQHDGLLFSLANITRPGYFELDHMEAFETPGVSFFLSLPGPQRSLYAFDLMVDTARKLAQALDGELRDEQQSMITPQTVEHYRQRVMEFERKQRMNEKVRQYRNKAGLGSSV